MSEKIIDCKLNFVRSIIFYLGNFNITGDVALFIACQFALESSFGSSNLSKKNNNYCGMKLPVVRLSTAKNFGSSDKWAVYLSLFDCITDFVLLLQFHKPNSCTFDSISHYKQFIDGWYCSDKSYLDKINSLYVQFSKQLQNGK